MMRRGLRRMRTLSTTRSGRSARLRSSHCPASNRRRISFTAAVRRYTWRWECQNLKACLLLITHFVTGHMFSLPTCIHCTALVQDPALHKCSSISAVACKAQVQCTACTLATGFFCASTRARSRRMSRVTIASFVASHACTALHFTVLSLLPKCLTKLPEGFYGLYKRPIIGYVSK
jgi:hypothetical protein